MSRVATEPEVSDHAGDGEDVDLREPALAGWPAVLRRVAGDVVLTRALLLGVAWLAQYLLATGVGSPGFRLDIWRRWDASLYLDIAQRGYAADVADGNAAAFFPLYPLGVRALAATGLGHLEAALLLSGLATLVACAYLYRLAEQVHGLDGARAALYLLLFPTAVFLAAPYTEALFLAGAIPAFHYAQRGRPWMAAPFAAVAVGTRTVGLLVLAGVAVELLLRGGRRWQALAQTAAVTLLGLLPLLAYGAYLWRDQGSFFAFLSAQRRGWYRGFVGPVDAFRTTWGTWHGGNGTNAMMAFRLEIVFALLSVALLAWLLWRRYWGYSVYVGGTLAVALTSTWYLSVPRLALAFFPFALLTAEVVGGGERRHTRAVVVLTGLTVTGTIAYTSGAWFF